jgi:hypothetical protein
VGRDLSKKEELAKCLESFNQQIIGKIKPPEEEPGSRQRLVRLEPDLQLRLSCMSKMRILLQINFKDTVSFYVWSVFFYLH